MIRREEQSHFQQEVWRGQSRLVVHSSCELLLDTGLFDIEVRDRTLEEVGRKGRLFHPVREAESTSATVAHRFFVVPSIIVISLEQWPGNARPIRHLLHDAPNGRGA